MLIRYSCKDMGLNCSFVVKGESLAEVTVKAMQHIREVHAKDFNPIQSPGEITQMEKSLMRSTRVVAG